MNSTYAQKSSTVQKAADAKAASVLDSSAQSESLQRKADMANNAIQRAEAPRPNNTGMPDNLKSGIESLSGFSMDNVRVHYNSSKPATVQALAYTQGTDIHVAPGQEKHLPHEAWHVAQQMAGRVSPTTNINGMPVNDNAALEHEADVMGGKAVQCKMVGVSFTNGKVQNTAVQRMAFYSGSVVGTVQIEGKPLFGRERGTARCGDLALLVDLYKKEMLTYIANLIQMLPIVESGKNTDFGPHISVIIAGGNWYIAINSTEESPQKLNELITCSRQAKEIIQEEFKKIKKAYAVNKQITEDKIENCTDFTIEEQAIYIAYRWAAKKGGVVVTNENRTQKPADGCCEHGEMHSIDELQRNKLNWNYDRIKKMIGECLGNDPKKIDFVAKEIESFLLGLEKPKDDVYFEFILGKVKKDNLILVYINTPFNDWFGDVFEGKLKLGSVKTEIYDVVCEMFFRMLRERVVRVGGSKTPCNDCADEMMSLSRAHNIIKGRRIVLMSNKSGSGYKNWGILGETGQTPLTTGSVNPIAGQTSLTTSSVNSAAGQTPQKPDFINPCDNAYYRRGDGGVVVKGFDLNQDLHYLNLFEKFTSLTAPAAEASQTAPAAAASQTAPAADAYFAIVKAFEMCRKIENLLMDGERKNEAKVQEWKVVPEDEIKKRSISGDEKIEVEGFKSECVGMFSTIDIEISEIRKLVEDEIRKKLDSLSRYKQWRDMIDSPSKLKTALNSKNRQLRCNNSIIGKLNKENQQSEQKISELQEKIQVNKQGNSESQSAVSEITQEISELRKKIQENEQKISESQSAVSEITQEISKLENEIQVNEQKASIIQELILVNPDIEKYMTLNVFLEKIKKDFCGNSLLKMDLKDFSTVLYPENTAVGPGEWFWAKRIVYDAERILCKCVSMLKTLRMIVVPEMQEPVELSAGAVQTVNQ